MIVKEYCRYVRSYSELEGLQRARTVYYSASRTPEGVLMELEQLDAGRHTCSRILCPGVEFARAMRLTRYLCENGVEPGQWLEVLQDLGQPFRLIPEPNAPQTAENAVTNGEFVAFV